jgi:PKD repeat protein
MAVPQSIDGVSRPADPSPQESSDAGTPPPQKPPVAPVAPEVRRLKQALLIVGSLAFAGYILWGVMLITMLPDPSGGLEKLVLIGALSQAIGILVLLFSGAVGFMRIKKSTAPVKARQFALIKLGAAVVPAAIFSAVVVFLIMQEPSLSIDIVSPTKAEEFVAPLPVTLSVERAVGALEPHGFTPLEYIWDLRGDGKMLEKTVAPRLTATFDREGVYPIAVRITGSDGSSRKASRRIVIQRSVFSVSPNPPIVDRPVALSLLNLVKDAKTFQDAEWDLDGDGQTDEKSKDLQISTVYHRTGPVTVAVVVHLANKTQMRYDRTLNVVEPPVLPFPVSVQTEPKKLIGAKPFGVLFTIQTEEDISDVQWSFGDGSRGEGMRIAHTYAENGTYAVIVRIRSAAGETAEITTVVEVSDVLQIPDLSFDGLPKVSAGKISGELPLKINITPKTKQPFVTFSWEVPGDIEVASTDGTLSAIYRDAGSYSVVLVAENAERRVLRMPIAIEVTPPSSQLSFTMEPESGVAPLMIKLDATSTVIPEKTITGFEWSFGDDSEPEFGSARTEHVFTKAGTYTVQLSVRTTDGKEFVTTKTIVVLPPILRPCILPSRTKGRAPLGIKFSIDCSVGDPASILWDFGDDSQTDEESPVHVFEDAGEYDVTLTFADGEGNEQSATVTVTAIEP